MMTKERAELLDRILRQATETNSFVEIPIDESTDRSELISVGNELKRKGFGKLLQRGNFQITHEGLSFIKQSSFVKLFNEQNKIAEQDNINFELTKKKLKAANREPYLIIWSIITTLTTLILAYLNFIKD